MNRTISNTQIKTIISKIENYVANNTLSSKILAEVLTTSLGGSDSEGRWNWRQAYDLTQGATINVCVNLIKKSIKDGQNPKAILEKIEDIISHIPTESRRTERQVLLQQFSTPISCAWVALQASGITSGDVVLEPSAGTGVFSTCAKHIYGATVITNEIDPLRAKILEETNVYMGTQHDGEFIDDLLCPKIKPTLVLINPPFSSSTSRSNDQTIAIRHVLSAAKRLSEGGRLVAIIPPCMTKIRQAALWRRLVGQVKPIMCLTLEKSVFYKHGTSIETQILICEKTKNTRNYYVKPEPVSLREALQIFDKKL